MMGKDGRGRPDFVKFTYKGGGSLYLQLAPLAFSNFFLLHKDNRIYYEKAISNLPSKASEVLWDDYYRYSHNEDFSAFQYILSNKSLRWAFWLTLVLFALIYLFDSKRRQRMIPLISPLRNTSVDFVRTIGRLYFQRRDNHNLAMKMVAHFRGPGPYPISYGLPDNGRRVHRPALLPHRLSEGAAVPPGRLYADAALEGLCPGRRAIGISSATGRIL
ncbi:hypothetical protein ACQ86N_13470 [Puia sp. P3]|uniref:hypothetical protein n=1 Tax=Puia sp. P3 TaxID=3423952 RepID=UPI003D664872